MANLNILILYGANATFTNTVMEHLHSYAKFSRHNVCFSSIHRFDPGSFPDLAAFDVVVLHYSFFPGLHWKMPEALELKLRNCAGLKVLYAQDEYDHTEATRGWIEQLGIRCMFTCVPAECIDLVYPRKRFPNVEFRTTLTGFVPEGAARLAPTPLSQRPVVIGYRGRTLHPRYGHLAREKLIIGESMRRICEERKIPVDIECSEDKRIYGDAWYEFLGRCRATLATESGSNVLDEDGTLKARIDAALVAEPDLSYDAIHQRFIGEREGQIRMNQVSPRIFEAIAMHTALILFEGRYSDAVRPWDHYLPLKSDFSNVDEVLGRLGDIPSLEAMTKRAYREVIEGGRFGYEAFIRDFDAYVESRATPRGSKIVSSVLAALPHDARASFLRASPCSTTNLPIEARWVAPPAKDQVSGMALAMQKVRSLLGRLLRVVRTSRGRHKITGGRCS